MDCLDLHAVQGNLKSLPQHHSSKASILHCSAFFIVQLSHPYMTTGKTIALTRRTFVGKVMSLLFNMLSRLGFPCGSAGKESACNEGDLGSIPGLGRSPREGKGYPLQYSGLENYIGCVVHGVAKSWTQLSKHIKKQRHHFATKGPSSQSFGFSSTHVCM